MELRREGLLSKTARLDYMIFKTEVREEPHGCQEESTPGKRTSRLQAQDVFPNLLELLLCQLPSLTSHHIPHVHPNTRAA